MPHRKGSAKLARTLGARIRVLREASGQTQEKTAWAAGLDKGFLSQVEAGKRLVSIPALLALAEEIGVRAVDLLAFDRVDPVHQLLDAVRLKDADGVHKALNALGIE